MLRILIGVLSIMAMILVAYLIWTARNPIGLEEAFQIFLMVGYPSLVLFYAITVKPASDKPTYLDLFFERRRLEEQAKIDKLKSDAK